MIDLQINGLVKLFSCIEEATWLILVRCFMIFKRRPVRWKTSFLKAADGRFGLAEHAFTPVALLSNYTKGLDCQNLGAAIRKADSLESIDQEVELCQQLKVLIFRFYSSPSSRGSGP